MKDKIKLKFLGVKHKWIYYHTDSEVFQDVINKISEKVHNNEIKSKSAIQLVKCFKRQDKVFLKFIKTIGRKNFFCQCYLIDEDNNKVSINLDPITLLESSLLNGTPKSLKLYKSNLKKKNVWKKPDDGFSDPVSYPPAEEELTELGYNLYKDWTEEVASSGLTSKQYYRKLLGIDKYYKKD